MNEARIFRMLVTNFYVFVIVDVNQSIFIRAKELCSALGFKNLSNITREEGSGIRKFFRDFNICNNLHKIPNNSVFIDLKTMIHMLNNAKISVLTRAKIVRTLHKILTFLMRKKSGTQPEYIYKQMFVDGIPVKNNQVYPSLTINFLDGQTENQNQELIIPIQSSRVVLNDDFLKILNSYVEIQQKNVNYLKSFLKNLM